MRRAQAEEIQAARMQRIEEVMVGSETRLNHITETLVGLGEDTGSAATAIGVPRTDMQSITTSAPNQVNSQFDQSQAALVRVVNDAGAEFEGIRNAIQGLYGGTGDTFMEVRNKVEELEREVQDMRANPSGVGGGGFSGNKGFLPLKSQQSKQFGKMRWSGGLGQTTSLPTWTR